MISMIVATAQNRVIGKNGTLPWRCPSDMCRFRELTMGHPVVMGRNTWESIPDKFRPLPGRRNIVLSSTLETLPDAETCHSFQQVLSLLEGQDAFVMGGARVYETAMPFARKLYLTKILAEVEGDVFFPPITNEWTLVEKIEAVKADNDQYPLEFLTFVK